MDGNRNLNNPAFAREWQFYIFSKETVFFNWLWLPLINPVIFINLVRSEISATFHRSVCVCGDKTSVVMSGLIENVQSIKMSLRCGFKAAEVKNISWEHHLKKILNFWWIFFFFFRFFFYFMVNSFISFYFCWFLVLFSWRKKCLIFVETNFIAWNW